MTQRIISTPRAPAAIGPYSQAVAVNNTVYLSGQIGLDPVSMTLVEGGIEAQTLQVMANLKAVVEAAGGSLDQLVRVTLYLTDLAHFSTVNDAMARHFKAPYPARATIGVAALPRGALVEMDGILELQA